MLRFDRKKFFDGYRDEFGRVTQSQVAGLEQLLTFIENDPYVTAIEPAAFLLATPKHETADTFKPIHEYGGKAYFIKRYGSQTKVGKQLGNDSPEEGFYYAGKGYPQTTGESNYEKLEDAIRAEYPEIVADFERRTGKVFDLTVGDQPNDIDDPQNMLDPAIAYVSMSYGSRVGLFTGKKLSQYNLNTAQGRRNSRRIINGLDKADTIADYIKSFIDILKASEAPTASSGSGANELAALFDDERSPVAEADAVEPGAGADPGLGQEPAPAPPVDAGVERTVLKTSEGASAVSTTTKNEQDINATAIVEGVQPYNEIGLKDTLKGDAKAILPANLGLNTFSEFIQQTTGWPVWVTTLIPKLVIGALIVTAVWLLYRLASWLMHNWRENERVKLLAQINSDPTRKDVKLQ